MGNSCGSNYSTSTTSNVKVAATGMITMMKWLSRIPESKLIVELFYYIKVKPCLLVWISYYNFTKTVIDRKGNKCHPRTTNIIPNFASIRSYCCPACYTCARCSDTHYDLPVLLQYILCFCVVIHSVYMEFY